MTKDLDECWRHNNVRASSLGDQCHIGKASGDKDNTKDMIKCDKEKFTRDERHPPTVKINKRSNGFDANQDYFDQIIFISRKQ